MSTRARVFGVLFALIVAGAIGIAVSAIPLERRLHDWVTSRLSRSLDSEVELGGVTLNWIPLRLHARDLIVRHHGRRDIPPLLVVASFTVDLKTADLLSSTVDRVWVEGLEINIPPKDIETGKRPIPRPAQHHAGDDADDLIVRQLTATNTRLSMIPREAGKNPKIWDIHELDMKNLRGGEAAAFTAALINPVPYGTIEASGTFGPWQSDEPGDSPLSGAYTFAADLGTINGLAGQLNATGTMDGKLGRIATRGQTQTPDFRLTELDGTSLPVDASYDAIVDGTKGDVELKRVDVTLGRSRLHARGIVEGTRGVKGKRVMVNVRSSSADLGQLLQLVSKAARPAAEGVLSIDATMDLPQGVAPILERVALQGSIGAEGVKFSAAAVQDKIDELSRRGQGRPNDASIDEVASRMATKFSLTRGVMTYRGLSFNVLGAAVRLDGTHSLRSKAVDLAGVVLLNATVSQTQQGFKSWLLKPFDGLFRKQGAGTRLVINVAGTQDQPKVALEIGKTLRGQEPTGGRGQARR